MNIRNKFLELRFCMCEDESQIDNFVDVADNFAISFALWMSKNQFSLDTYDNKGDIKELLEMYKKAEGL